MVGFCVIENDHYRAYNLRRVFLTNFLRRLWTIFRNCATGCRSIALPALELVLLELLDANSHIAYFGGFFRQYISSCGMSFGNLNQFTNSHLQKKQQKCAKMRKFFCYKVGTQLRKSSSLEWRSKEL